MPNQPQSTENLELQLATERLEKEQAEEELADANTGIQGNVIAIDRRNISLV